MNKNVYDFTELDVRSERMQLIKDKDFDEYFRLMDELTGLRTKAARGIIFLAHCYGCLRIRPTEGITKNHTYYLHPSLYERGALQYTSTDEYGPVTHWTIHNASELERELPARKFTCEYDWSTSYIGR